MNRKKIRAVAFDLDHTLYDRYGTLRRISCLLKQKFPGRLNPALSAARTGDMLVEADRNYIYEGWSVMYEHLTAQNLFLDPPSFPEYFAFFMEAFCQIAVPFPGVDCMLEELRTRGCPTGLLTNGEAGIQRAKVRLVGLENSFDRILAGEEMGLQKPSAHAFEKMAECLGCTPEEMVYVGDNPRNDVDAARRAGCVPVWVRVSGKDWNFPEYERPLYVIDNVLELPALLEGLEGWREGK